jgi:hypothetical protein
MRNRSPKRASELKPDPAAHYNRLADEFGMPRGGTYHARDAGRPMTGRHFWLQPLTLFILSLLALVLVSSLQLWRLGWFSVLFGAKSAEVDRSSKRWLLNGRSARTADDRTLNAPEPDIDRGPAPADDEATDNE